jgi:hypothetical protein
VPLAPAYNLAFPPFPSTQGKTVIPFADFVPRGLAIKDHDDQGQPEEGEVDAEGIPTVPLGVVHELDKKKAAFSRKKKNSPSYLNEDGTPKRWYEQWADREPAMTAERLDP